MTCLVYVQPTASEAVGTGFQSPWSDNGPARAGAGLTLLASTENRSGPSRAVITLTENGPGASRAVVTLLAKQRGTADQDVPAP